MLKVEAKRQASSPVLQYSDATGYTRNVNCGKGRKRTGWEFWNDIKSVAKQRVNWRQCADALWATRSEEHMQGTHAKLAKNRS